MKNTVHSTNQRTRKNTIAIEHLEARIAPATFRLIADLSSLNRGWGQAGTWFNVTNNVADGSFPNSEDDIAIIDGSHTSGAGNLTVGSLFAVGEIQFSDDVDLTIGANPGGELTIDRPGTLRGLIAHSGTGDLLIRPQINTADGVNFNVSSTGELDYQGVLTGASGFGGYTKTGTGTMKLTGGSDNTFNNSTGGGPGFIVNAGTLVVQKTNAIALSSQTAVAASATLIVGTAGGGEQIADGALVTVNGTMTLNVASEGIGRLQGSGLVELNGNTLRLGANGGGLTSNFAGQLNAGTLDLTGGGTAVVFSPGPANVIGSATSGANITGGNVSFAVYGTTPGVNSELLTLTGGATLSPATVTFDVDTTQFNAALGGNILGTTFTVVAVQDGATQTPFDGMPEGAVVKILGNGGSLAITYTGGDGNDVALRVILDTTGTEARAVQIDAKGRSATFTDTDGDTVTIKTNKGGFVPANFLLSGFTGIAGETLQKLDLSFATAGLSFKGATITVAVTRGAAGNGLVNIGAIDATGVDLVKVSLPGDLGQIDAGDTNARTPGLGALSATSLGAYAFTQSGAGKTSPGDYSTSTIVGKLGSVTASIGKLLVAAPAGVFGFLDVVGDAIATNARFATIGKITADNVQSIGIPTEENANSTVKFASGSIRAVGSIGTVFIENLVVGGAGDFSGTIWSRASISSVKVGGKIGAGNIIGGTGFDTGAIFVGSPDTPNAPLAGKISTVSIKGSLVGGAGGNGGTIYADGGLGSVTIGGSINGGLGQQDGGIFSGGSIGSVRVKGNVIGGGDAAAGIIFSVLNIGSVRVDGSLNGGQALQSGSIVALGKIGTVTIGAAASYNSTVGALTGIFSGATIGTVTIGSLTAAPGALGLGSIFALGNMHAKTGAALSGNAIGSLKIAGTASGWNIIAGTDIAGSAFTGAGTFNPEADIGTITIGGNATNLAIATGTNFVNGLGGGDDIHLPGDVLPTSFAQIAKITILGQSANVIVEAQKVSAVTGAGVKAALTTGIDAFVNNIAGLIVAEIP